MDVPNFHESLRCEEAADCELDAARTLAIAEDSFLLDAPASRPRFFFFRPYVTGFGFFMLGATALYLAFSNWSQPTIGAVMLQNDGFPVLGLAHVSPAAVDVLCVIDISQMVARVNIQGLLIPVANEQCDFDALRRRGIKVGKVEKQRCASFLLLNIINLDLFLGALSDSLSQCSASLNVPANCAANIFSIVGTTTLIAQSAVQMDYTCIDHENNLTVKVQQEKAKAEQAKLDVKRDVQNFLKDQGLDVDNLLPPDPAVAHNVVYRSIAGCFGSIVMSTTFIMRLAIILADAIVHCPKSSGAEPKICALDLLGVLALISASIRFVATSVITCSAIIGESNSDAQCTQAASALPTGVFSVSAVLGNVEAACSKAFLRWNPDEWPTKKNQPEEEGEEGDLIIPDV